MRQSSGAFDVKLTKFLPSLAGAEQGTAGVEERAIKAARLVIFGRWF